MLAVLAQASATPHSGALRNLAAAESTPIGLRLVSFAGIFVLIGLCWLLSRNRRAIRWRPVLWGIGLQFLVALIVLSPGVGDTFFDWTNAAVGRLLSFSEAGADFVFQSIDPHEVVRVAPDGTRTTELIGGRTSPAMKTIAFWVLPTIIFFSALMSVLYHLGIMQFIVRGMSWIMARTMGTSGAESLSTAANVFLGQTEAPLLVRPFLDRMTRSELHAIMVGGFATVAGGVLAVYVGFLHKAMPDIAGHLVIASLMAAPATLVVSKLLLPETEKPVTSGDTPIVLEKLDGNVIEAMARGTTEGLMLFLNVIAMLIAFVAMVALVNYLFGLVGDVIGVKLSLERLLGWVFAPLAFAIGIPWDEAARAGQLLGEKTVLTELIAYLHLGEMVNTPGGMSRRTAVIMSYALCGFANFASIGIQIGGIGALAPTRRRDISELGLLAMIGGTIVGLMTGTIVGILI